MGETTHQKAPERVHIGPSKGGLRLRWTFGNNRKELYLAPTLPDYRKAAERLKMLIEQDLVSGSYDQSLKRYKHLLQRAVLTDLLENFEEQPTHIVPISRNAHMIHYESSTNTLDLVKEFDRYLAVKGKEDDPNYYLLTRKFLVKCGQFDLDDLPLLLSKEQWSAKTFNDRRNCLHTFCEWLKRRKKITDNPLIDVSNKERERMHEDREPFTDSEAASLLEALKTNRFVKKSSRYSHAQYYPFVAFLLHIGCRPGEAIGLKVRYVKFEHLKITIGHSLSRTNKGTSHSARIYKSTKNKKVRYIPMDDFLVQLLEPLCNGKQENDYVFLNENGNPIDDKMFLRRVLGPVQEALNIPYRTTYACRHSFATRAIREGMKPHEVAYLMGDTVETVLANYFHNNCMPTKLPQGIAGITTKEVLSIAS